MVCDGLDTEMVCRWRSSPSVSMAFPWMAETSLVTAVQPKVGVLISVMSPGSAVIAPAVAQVAVALMAPSEPMTTDAGKFHTLPVASFTLPFLISVNAVPVMVSSQVE